MSLQLNILNIYIRFSFPIAYQFRNLIGLTLKLHKYNITFLFFTTSLPKNKELSHNESFLYPIYFHTTLSKDQNGSFAFINASLKNKNSRQCIIYDTLILAKRIGPICLNIRYKVFQWIGPDRVLTLITMEQIVSPSLPHLSLAMRFT